MSKRILALVLASLLALSAFAFAEEADFDLVLGNGSKVYVAGEESGALSDVTISDILAANSAFVLYATEQETEEDEDAEYSLYLMRIVTEGLEDGDVYPTEEITAAAECAVWDEKNELLCYVDSADPKALYSFDPYASVSEVLVETDSAITSLRLSADGLLVGTDDAEMLYVHAIRQLAAPVYDSRAQEIKIGSGFDALLDTQEVLRARYSGDKTAVEVAQGVVAYIPQYNFIHYIARENGVFRLHTYVMDNGQTVLQTEYPEPILPVMTMSDSDIYAYSASGIVYDFHIVTGYLAPLNEEPFEINSPVLEAFEDYVLLYDDSLDASERFIAALHNSGITQGSDDDDELAAMEEEEQEEVKIAPTPKTTAVPAEEITLQRGMRGDDVKELQTLLNDNGYNCGKADGIFGQGTETALKLLQGDMGLEETGKATPSLRKKIRKGDIPEYAAYVDLSTGDTGIRVQRLQQRLRTLGYMTANAGGHYYSETTAAVKRFQEQNDYKVTGNITAKQMKALFKDSAAECTEYYELKKGDSSPMVKRLNKRLKKLGYLKGTADESYSKATVKAVKLFCTYNELSNIQSSSCTAKLQQKIFAKNAKKYEEADDPTPTPTPKPEKKAWRLPTKKELKVIYDWMKKNMTMGKDIAVQRIQLRLVELKYLDEDLVTGVYDDATAKAIYTFQKEVMNKKNAKGIAGKPTLIALFEDVN